MIPRPKRARASRAIASVLLAWLLVLVLAGSGCYLALARFMGIERGPSRASLIGEIMVPLSDGTRLATDVYLPEGEGPWPVILIRTPYNKRNSMHFTPHFGRLFAGYGYAVAIQDVRGRFASEGPWEPFVHEMSDGADTIAWVLRQIWCNGDIGTFGFSYFGFTQWAVGAQNLPGLRTMVVGISQTDPYHWFWDGGAYRMDIGSRWALRIAHAKRNRLDHRKELERIFNHLPPILGDDAAYRQMDFYDQWVSNDVPGDPYDQWLPADAAEKARVPVMLISGWFDLFSKGQMADYRILAQSPDPSAAQSRIVVGPWSHDLGFLSKSDVDLGSEASFAPIMRLVLEWFDHHLKGTGPAPAWGPVRTYEVGGDTWHDRLAWPPANASERRFCLSSDRILKSPGQAADEGALSFLYDPQDPVPTIGGNNLMPSYAHSKDQSGLDQREDILRFVTDPLTEPLRLAGPVSVDLFVSTTAEDTAFTAKLIDVFPNGKAVNILDGIRLLSRRESEGTPLRGEPGEVYALRLELGDTEWTLLPGHRLRLDVSSSNFPHYARHPNAFGKWALISETQTANQTVYTGGEHASRLTVNYLDY